MEHGAWRKSSGPYSRGECPPGSLRKWPSVLCLLVVLPMGLAGCSSVKAGKGAGKFTGSVDSHAEVADQLRADPVAYLRGLYQRCDGLQQYTLTFHRQERLGTLGPVEVIEASFRRDPFSVKFVWHDESMPYYESVYVAGQNGDKLLVRERKGWLLFPPQVRVLDLEFPVKVGRAKNPVTSFGLAQVTRRTLTPLEDPELAGKITVQYAGLVNLEPTRRPAHHLVIQRDRSAKYRYVRQDFYIDAETGWPAGTDLWLPSGDLDARYRYSEVDAAVQLTDADFRLSKDHPERDAAP